MGAILEPTGATELRFFSILFAILTTFWEKCSAWFPGTFKFLVGIFFYGFIF